MKLKLKLLQCAMMFINILKKHHHFCVLKMRIWPTCHCRFKSKSRSVTWGHDGLKPVKRKCCHEDQVDLHSADVQLFMVAVLLLFGSILRSYTSSLQFRHHQDRFHSINKLTSSRKLIKWCSGKKTQNVNSKKKKKDNPMQQLFYSCWKSCSSMSYDLHW